MSSSKIKNLTFNGATQEDSLYLEMPTGKWDKAYALIFGTDNVDGLIFEVISAYVNENNDIKVRYISNSTIKKTWLKDTTSNWNVHCESGFKTNGKITVIYSGFKKVGTYHL